MVGRMGKRKKDCIDIVLKNKVIGYARVSTEMQADSGYSLEAQRQDIERYCELYNLELIEIIADEGISAKSMNRPGIEKALNILTSGMAGGLIIAKLDRLTRSIRDLAALLEKYFTKYNLMSVSEQIDTSSASGRFVLHILVSVAQYEREATSERVQKAMNVKRNSGERIGSVPYGKKLKDDGLHTNRKNHPTNCHGCLNLEDNPDESIIIAAANGMKDGNMTYRAICNQLNVAGNRRNRAGKPFTLSAVYRMVTS